MSGFIDQPVYTDCKNCGSCDHASYPCPCKCHCRHSQAASLRHRLALYVPATYDWFFVSLTPLVPLRMWDAAEDPYWDSKEAKLAIETMQEVFS